MQTSMSVLFTCPSFQVIRASFAARWLPLEGDRSDHLKMMFFLQVSKMKKLPNAPLCWKGWVHLSTEEQIMVFGRKSISVIFFSTSREQNNC